MTIKSHHNVGGLPERMNMKLVEPLARTVQGRGARARPRARPSRRVRRTPSVSGAGARDPHAPARSPREKLDILRQADTIYIEEIRRRRLYDEIWQAFAVLLPVSTVGVMGDDRTYDYVLRPARRDLDRRHDRGFLSLRHEFMAAWRRASSTRSRASTAWSTT